MRLRHWASDGRSRLLLPLVSREWKNGSNCSDNCTPFLHSLLTKGKYWGLLDLQAAGLLGLESPSLDWSLLANTRPGCG